MMPGSLVEAKHQGAQVGQPQPMGNHAPQNSAFLEDRVA
jgi:hypothetical protein